MIMTEQAVRVTRSGPVTTVLLHRPARRNAVDGPTAAALAAAFRAFDADPGAAVAVLHGEGGVFCSGADLTVLGTERGNRAAPDGDGPMGVSRLRLSKPVIAAVSGYAVAGGLELALWCDLRVADETAVFGVFCRRWGVPLIDGGTVRLPRLIGTSRAMDMILTGRAVDAAEAAAIGLAGPRRLVICQAGHRRPVRGPVRPPRRGAGHGGPDRRHGEQDWYRTGGYHAVATGPARTAGCGRPAVRGGHQPAP
jgi:enoyl-CoA hydratase/carnithine racemase